MSCLLQDSASLWREKDWGKMHGSSGPHMGITSEDSGILLAMSHLIISLYITASGPDRVSLEIHGVMEVQFLTLNIPLSWSYSMSFGDFSVHMASAHKGQAPYS